MPDLIDELRPVLPPDYMLVDFIDKGGQGAVFRGTVAGTPAAIKVFGPTTDPRRVLRELQLYQRIRCPTLARVLGTVAVPVGGVATTIVAYEFHAGGDLRALLAPGAPRPDSKLLAQIGRDVGAAVDALWRERIVHRDIKPANIVRASDGRFILVDVGLARHLDRSTLTAVGRTAGTLGYMSPEQAMGRRALTVHSDAFALGVTLRELAEGRHPWGYNQAAMSFSVVPPLAASRPDLAPQLARTIDRMILPRAAARPARLEELFQHYV